MILKPQAVFFAGCERSICDILVYPKTNFQIIESAFIVGLSYMFFFPKAGRLIMDLYSIEIFEIINQYISIGSMYSAFTHICQ